MKRAIRVLLVLVFACAGEQTSHAAESLGEKIQKFFVSPTPTRKRKHTVPKESPTPSPSSSPKHNKASPTPEPSETPKHKKASPTPEPSEPPKHKKSSTTPEPSETPKPKSKKKKKTSPTPTPSESPSPEEETPSPTATPGETPTPSPSPSSSQRKGAPNATISPNELSDYESYPESVRKIVDTALELTKQDLTYKYGSADPGNGGLDCSGFVYYVLTKNGVLDVPRDSSQQYVWVRKSGNFRAVISRDADTFELDALKPGDLLFWTGTYSIERDPPITHSMIYLGREKGNGRRIMVGASDGRSFDGIQRFGVSIFDFKLSRPKSDKETKLSPLFVGYGSIPGLEKP